MKQLNLLLYLKSFDHRHKLQAASLQGIYKNHSLPRERLKTILKGSHGHVGISFDIGKPNRLVFCDPHRLDELLRTSSTKVYQMFAWYLWKD